MMMQKKIYINRSTYKDVKNGYNCSIYLKLVSGLLWYIYTLEHVLVFVPEYI